MQKISSKMTFFHKRIFPTIWFGFLGSFGVITVFSGAVKSDPGFMVAPVFMAIFGYYLFNKLIFDLVDEVYDCSEFLVIRNKGEEDRISLSEILNVNYNHLTNPPRVTLSLRQGCKFGKEISFSPPVRLIPFAKSPLIEDLILRIDQKRPR